MKQVIFAVLCLLPLLACSGGTGDTPPPEEPPVVTPTSTTTTTGTRNLGMVDCPATATIIKNTLRETCHADYQQVDPTRYGCRLQFGAVDTELESAESFMPEVSFSEITKYESAEAARSAYNAQLEAINNSAARRRSDPNSCQLMPTGYRQVGETVDECLERIALPPVETLTGVGTEAFTRGSAITTYMNDIMLTMLIISSPSGGAFNTSGSTGGISGTINQQVSSANCFERSNWGLVINATIENL